MTKRILPTLFVALLVASQAGAQLPVIRGSGAQNVGSIQNSNQLVSDAFSYPFGYGDCTEFRLRDYRVTSDMLDPNYLDRNDIPIHTGEDWNRRVEAGGGGDNDLGDPVCSVGDGVVDSTGSYPTWSNVIVIRHDMPDGSTRWSQYAHLSEMLVGQGDTLRRGQMIGRIGKQFPEIACNTTTGEYCAHLHFEIRQQDVDPWNWPRDPNIIERQYLDPTDVESDDGMRHATGFIEANQRPCRLQTNPQRDLLWQECVDLDGDGQLNLVTITAVSPELLRGASDLGFGGCVSESSPDQKCRAVLQLGNQTAELVVNWQPSAYFDDMAIRVVDIDPADGRKELIIEQHGREEEDPWREFVVVMYDGNRLIAQPLWSSGCYDCGTLSIASDGQVVTHYEGCPSETRVVYRLDGPRLSLVETSRNERQTIDPRLCAACPAVYALVDGAERPMGEILRRIDSPDQKGWQSLRLFVLAEKRLEVVIREEKLETTYLDAVELDVDGRRYAPNSCETGEAAYCVADGRAHVMRTGDQLRLSFELDRPIGATDIVRLVANGYYVPDR